MRSLFLHALILVLISPLLRGGIQEQPCSNGIEIFFVNGVFTDAGDAQASIRALRSELETSVGSAPIGQACINVSSAYNQTRWWGAGDLLEAFDQIFLGAYSRFWDILGRALPPTAAFDNFADSVQRSITNLNYVVSDDLDAHLALYRGSVGVTPPNRNNKLVLLGHSQGNLYISRAHTRLTGESPGITASRLKAIAVATPEGSVAGESGPWESLPYTTLREDLVANVGFAFVNPLRLTPNTGNDQFPTCLFGYSACHEFIYSYLKGNKSGPQIIDQIVTALTALIAGGPNQPPTAGFTMTSIPQQPVNEGGTLNLSVTPNGSSTVFFDSSTRANDSDGSVTGWQWRVDGALVSTGSSFSQPFTARPALYDQRSNYSGVITLPVNGTALLGSFTTDAQVHELAGGRIRLSVRETSGFSSCPTALYITVQEATPFGAGGTIVATQLPIDFSNFNWNNVDGTFFDQGPSDNGRLAPNTTYYVYMHTQCSGGRAEIRSNPAGTAFWGFLRQNGSDSHSISLVVADNQGATSQAAIATVNVSEVTQPPSPPPSEVLYTQTTDGTSAIHLPTNGSVPIGSFTTGNKIYAINGSSLQITARETSGFSGCNSNGSLYVDIIASNNIAGDLYAVAVLTPPYGNNIFKTYNEGLIPTSGHLEFAANHTYYVFMHTQCSGGQADVQSNAAGTMFTGTLISHPMTPPY